MTLDGHNAAVPVVSSPPDAALAASSADAAPTCPRIETVHLWNDDHDLPREHPLPGEDEGAAISVRIASIDFVLQKPGDLDRSVVPFLSMEGYGRLATLGKVPIVRVFGAVRRAGASPADALSDQRACVYIHWVFPYLFVPFPEEPSSLDDVTSFAHRLGNALNRALNAAKQQRFADQNQQQQQQQTRPGRAQKSEDEQFVVSITPVRAISIYGYHQKPRVFLKIWLSDPSQVGRAADLLNEGAILHAPLAPHDAHLPYLLQFLADHALAGMAWMHLTWAREVALTERTSHCAMELHTTAAHILNRRAHEERAKRAAASLSQPPSRSDPESATRSNERIMGSLDALWRDEARRRERIGLPSYNDRSKDVVRDLQFGEPPKWNERYRKDIESWLESIRTNSSSAFDRSLGGISPTDDFMESIPWVQDSVPLLWPVPGSLPVPSWPGASQAVTHASMEIARTQIAAEVPLPRELLVYTDIAIFTQDLFSRPQTQVPVDKYQGAENEAGFELTQDLLQWMLDEQRNAATSSDTEAQDDEFSVDYTEQIPVDTIKDQQGVNGYGAGMRGEQRTEVSMETEEEGPEDAETSAIEEDFAMDDGEDEEFWAAVGAKIPQYDGPGDWETQATDLDSQWSRTSAAIGRVSSRKRVKFKRVQLDEDAYRDIRESCHTAKPPSWPVKDPLNDGLWSPDPAKEDYSDWALDVPAALLWQSQGELDPIMRSLDTGCSSSKPPSRQPSSLPSRPPEEVVSIEEQGAESRPACRTTWTLRLPPPTWEDVQNDLKANRIEECVHLGPFFGGENDAHEAERVRTFAGKTFRIPVVKKSGMVPPSFDDMTSIYAERSSQNCRMPNPTQSVYSKSLPSKTWVYCRPPPTRETAEDSWRSDVAAHSTASQGRLRDCTVAEDVSQGIGPAGEREQEHLLCLAVDVQVCTREALQADPAQDPIDMIFFCIYCDSGANGSAEPYQPYRYPCKSQGFSNERAMIEEFIHMVRQVDPDVITGYEIHSSSWGYIIERCHFAFAMDLCQEISRIKIVRRSERGMDQRGVSAWGYRKGASYQVPGRIILNVWRLLRSELACTDYSLENMCARILKWRIPKFKPAMLTKWYRSEQRSQAVLYGIRRVRTTLELLVAGDYLDRTSEFARLYGIDFQGVLMRGSQYRVEASFMRICRPAGYVFLSPSRRQVAGQRAAECIPLVMEPESAFYPDPVLVLDYQSLYPSIMIAHNLCFSTCLGKAPFRGSRSQKLGVTNYELEEVGTLTADDIFVTPNGIMFVREHIRKSMLAKMLIELLETRVMVKQSMKLYHGNKSLTRLLDSRQLALKLLANVIYGYTAASFSGRMPCVEVGDSVVQTGRETLEGAIRKINTTSDWGARVVYGDTDSVFVQLKGKSKDSSFRIGNCIADSVTKMTKNPIKLKFEKVYLPSILVTKKRYLGYMFESPSDLEPVWDAKGIETVRRDGCPAVGKIMRTSVEILFRERDLSAVKSYLVGQYRKIMENRVCMQDYIIAKEVKLGTYSDNGLPPPGAYLSLQRMRKDARAEPQYGERVPYVVVYGAPGDRLIDQVCSPEDALARPELRINAHYYITKQIGPALNRLFNLMGVDVLAWFREMPKPAVNAAQAATSSQLSRAQRATIERYYAATQCPGCMRPHARQAGATLCLACAQSPTQTATNVLLSVRQAQAACATLNDVCATCSGLQGDREVECVSLACPVLYDRVVAAQTLRTWGKNAKDLGLLLSW